MNFLQEYLLPKLIQVSPTLERRRGLLSESTSRITKIVQLAAYEAGGICKLEFSVKVNYPDKIFRGYLDAFIMFKNGKCYAIEIDRSNKKRSLLKLQYCHEAYGYNSIWIRWSGSRLIEAPSGICVVDMRSSNINVVGCPFLTFFQKCHYL